jgi:hypothetical protein
MCCLHPATTLCRMARTHGMEHRRIPSHCRKLLKCWTACQVARLEAEMEAGADTVRILKELNATRASARDRQNAMERRCVCGPPSPSEGEENTTGISVAFQ